MSSEEIKVGIMQPYFFPYLGYFQLISAVDKYVNLDHVSFMKRSYMTRNTLRDGIEINVNVSGGSQNKTCREVFVNFENNYISKFLKTIQQMYSRSPYYDTIMQTIILPEFVERKVSISEFNLGIIKKICKFLEIKTEIIETSSVFGNEQLKRESGLIDTIHQLGGSIYINAIGGQSLYQKEYFKIKDVDLCFIQMGKSIFPNGNASILDLLFTYEKSILVKEISNYTLI